MSEKKLTVYKLRHIDSYSIRLMNMSLTKFLSFFSIFYFYYLSCCLSAQDFGLLKTSVIKKGNNSYVLGNVEINSKIREITIPGWINMEKGMIELLACAPGGKTHESVLVLDIVPSHLQVALLLLGLNYGRGIDYQEDIRTPTGDSLIIWVEWKSKGKIIKRRAEELVWDIHGNKPMAKTHWVFTGSKVIDGEFIADLEKSLVTTYNNPYTIIDNPLTTGNDDEVYGVNEKVVPPKNTPVKLIFKKYE